MYGTQLHALLTFEEQFQLARALLAGRNEAAAAYEALTNDGAADALQKHLDAAVDRLIQARQILWAPSET